MPRAAPYTELAVRSRGLKQAPVACKLTHALKLLLPQNGEKCSRDERVQKYKRLRAEIAAAIKIYRFNCAIEGQETLGSIDQALRLMRRKVARRQRAKKELMEEMAKPYTKRDLPRAYREWSRHARAGPAALLEWEVEQFGEAAVRECYVSRKRPSSALREAVQHLQRVARLYRADLVWRDRNVPKPLTEFIRAVLETAGLPHPDEGNPSRLRALMGRGDKDPPSKIIAARLARLVRISSTLQKLFL